jgi:hypothetical protein
MKLDAPLLFPNLITRGVEPPPKPSNISKRVEYKLGDVTLVSRPPTRSWRCRSRPPPCIKPTSSRKVASPDVTPTAKANCGRRAKDPCLHRPVTRHEFRRPARLSGGDWRRVRRQDRGLHRAGGRRARTQVRPGPRLILDNDGFGGIARLVERIGDNHRDRVADVHDAIEHNRRPRR